MLGKKVGPGPAAPEVIDKVAWTPVDHLHRRVLMARTRGNELLYTVGGKREPGETDEQTLVREVMEEAAVQVLLPAHYLTTIVGPAAGKHAGKMVKLACYDAGWKGALAPSSEVEELAWVTTKDANRTTETGRMVLQWLYERGHID